jgi:hypothetical protein
MPGKNCLGFGYAQPSTQSVVGVDGTSGGNTVPYQAKGCIITIETKPIRWRADGTDPTTGLGHSLAAGSSLTFDSWTSPYNDWYSVLKKLKFISSCSSTALLNISFFD